MRFEHAAGDQVVEQARKGGVELGEQGVLERGEVVAVGVPGGVGVGRPRDARDARAGLDQPSGEQHALAVDVPAVAVAGARVLAIDAEGVANRRRSQNVEGAGLKAVEVAKPPVSVQARVRPAQAAASSRRPCSLAGVDPGGRSTARACRSRRRSGP